MKLSLCTGVFLVMSHCTIGQNLEVIVKNVKNSKGVLMVGVFNSQKTFTRKAWGGQKPPAMTGTVKVTFNDIPPGEYAISVYHDVNENGQLDSNFMGIPKEGFGFSNDVMGAFGPPTFEKARFKYPTTQVVSVTLKYF